MKMFLLVIWDGVCREGRYSLVARISELYFRLFIEQCMSQKDEIVFKILFEIMNILIFLGTDSGPKMCCKEMGCEDCLSPGYLSLGTLYSRIARRQGT